MVLEIYNGFEGHTKEKLVTIESLKNFLLSNQIEVLIPIEYFMGTKKELLIKFEEIYKNKLIEKLESTTK